MLVPCPECGRKVSDQAVACPECGYPVAQKLAEQAAAREHEAARATRREVPGAEVDCAACEARGFRTWEVPRGDGSKRTDTRFEWCAICEHSGRVVLCESALGFYAVGYAQLADFLAGRLDEGAPGVTLLGKERPTEHRYPAASPRAGSDEQG